MGEKFNLPTIKDDHKSVKPIFPVAINDTLSDWENNLIRAKIALVHAL